MVDEIERIKRSMRAEIVPYGAYDADKVSIPIKRRDDDAEASPER